MDDVLPSVVYHSDLLTPEEIAFLEAWKHLHEDSQFQEIIDILKEDQ